ncbi:MAG: MFS transporter [bacterium]|nr:MFS transporter [bacterium]
MNTHRRGLSPLLTIYVVAFFYTLHAAIPVYVNSSFLSTLVSTNYVGAIYTAGSLLTIFALILIPKILRLVGDYFTTLLFIVLEIAALIGIAASGDPKVIIGLFILSSVLVTLISFDFDLIVEGFSKNGSTGSIRGLYLTSANIAWVIAPALAGMLLAGGAYWRIYLVSAALFIPGLLIFSGKLERFKDPLYRTIHFKKTLASVWQNRNLRHIFGISFLLQLFFTLMVIYTPIYLHDRIGFSWGELGPIFSIMLLPFLLLEAPLGRLADKVLGEKELLIAGFSIMALATGVIYFVTAHSLALWAAILFMTRVGAAMVEIMTETYFFKKIDAGDASIVGLNRTVRPFAGVVGPLVATGLLVFISLPSLFLVLGALMLLGIPLALTLKDTR